MEKWETAYSDYKKGLKYKEIAEKHRVSLNTVKSWAVRYWKKLDKDNEKEVATNMGEKLQPKKKPGAPKGNQNAVGNDGGPPVGSQNNYKHGLYARININTLSEDEYDYLIHGTVNVSQELELMTKLDNIKVKRFYDRMTSISTTKSGLVLNGVSKTTSKDKDGKVCCENTTTQTSSADDLVIRYSNAIEAIERKKIKCLELINNIELNKKKTNEFTSEAVTIYLPENERGV